jgi:hypothetical protein
MRQALALALIGLLCAISSGTAQARGGGSSSGHSSSHLSTSHVSTGTVNSSSHSVSGYTRKDGTYVAPSHATDPNGTKNDNYSTKGNVNPYTGKAGTKKPDAR